MTLYDKINILLVIGKKIKWSVRVIILELTQTILPQYFSVTGEQTDGQTTYHGNTALCVAPRGKIHERNKGQSKIVELEHKGQQEVILSQLLQNTEKCC